MTLAIIAAVTENGVIGRDGDMPWHLPADLAYFKRTTVGHSIVMGRRTFESFGGKPLPKRRNIIVTRDSQYQAEDTLIAHSLSEALQLASEAEAIFICGGAAIYREALPQTDRLYLTRIHAELAGDTFFPDIDWTHWQLVEETARAADEKNQYDLSFRIYQRRVASLS